MLLSGLPALGQDESNQPIVMYDIRHDVSPALRDLPRTPRPPVTTPQVVPLRQRPVPSPAGSSAQGADPVLQQTTGPLISATSGSNFDGVGANGYAPPDTNLSVGATQIVQIVNVEYAVYDKSTGNPLLGPFPINHIWTGFGGLCQNTNGGDPIVLYDKAAGRWMISQLAYNSSLSSSNVCVAVSTSSDATGTFNRYAFSFGRNFPDYPKFGVWPDAYYFSANMFRNGSRFIGAQACAYDRAAMLAGPSAAPVRAVCFQRPTSDFSLLPSDLDGSTAPPSGQPNFFVEFVTNGLRLYKFHADFATPANSTFTGTGVSNVAPFTPACGNGGVCIPQAGTNQSLDSLGDRLMYRLAYRNFGTYESLVVNHSVNATVGGTSTVGVRWYEIHSPNSSPAVFQSGTFAPDTTYRWMGSMGMDKVGDIAVGYSASSSSINPAIRYTGRVPTDNLGTLESEATILSGTGSQTGSLSRWGDYSSISIDPVDDCTFWYTNEYLTTNGSYNWNTRIASFKITGCQ
jgi:hypothetical protein